MVSRRRPVDVGGEQGEVGPRRRRRRRAPGCRRPSARVAARRRCGRRSPRGRARRARRRRGRASGGRTAGRRPRRRRRRDGGLVVAAGRRRGDERRQGDGEAAWAPSRRAMHSVTRRAVGRWRNSFGPWALLPGHEDAGDDELGVGEPLAEHAHERDRPALAERARRLAEGRRATPRRARRRSHGANAGAFQPGADCGVLEARPWRRTAGRRGACARSRPSAASWSHVGGRRKLSASVVDGRSTLPARLVGGMPSAPM